MQNANQYTSDIKFVQQMNYTNMLMQRIGELQFSLRIGKDCSNEFFNIMNILTDGIKKPIESKINEITQEYTLKVKEIMEMNTFPEEKFQWSKRHRQKYISTIVNKIQTEAIHKMLNILINQLDEMGLLINREKQTQI
ncbi:MAG: hypothetical protein Q8N08_07485 [Methanobacteriaceae archaeon]|nr:hypothetical protein [Methanobacteriaceae archaeon]